MPPKNSKGSDQVTAMRQHLIDPEICIRCNTCEETCPVDAITHNSDNYVVMIEKCEFCMNCVAPCPTGAIDNWREVNTAYTLEEQYSWEELPDQEDIQQPSAEPATGYEQQSQDAIESEASKILELAHSSEGKVLPPFSAAHPYINIYTREKPAIAKVAGNYRITDSKTESDIHHIVLDFGHTSFPVLEGQSIGVIPPGKDTKGKENLVRLYSVASPRDGERPNHNNLSITVKRVVLETDNGKVEGVCSNYLCDLEKGAEVQVTGPFGNTFLMPNHPEANIIMICTGTGSAPFRAMTERRRRKRNSGDSGKLLLFFGARSKGELPYFGPLKKLPHDLIDKELVFSREEGTEKEYVQDRMLKRSADIADLLNNENTYIYLCGLKDMEKGVNDAMHTICNDHNLDWSVKSLDMRQQGRLHIETY
jgi:benzoyl-CoA 2,3-epoxidase subunit A